MYSVTVRGHMMIAHSLTGDIFGPAQRLHGATYVVDVEFRRSDLDSNGIVVDIGRATDALNEVLAGFSYRNLDEESSLKGKTTTTRTWRVRRSTDACEADRGRRSRFDRTAIRRV